MALAVQSAVNGNTAAGTSIAATFAGSVVAGRKIVVWGTGSGSHAGFTITDSQSNTYTKGLLYDSTNDQSIFWGYTTAGSSTAATVTLTMDSGTPYRGIIIAEYANAGALLAGPMTNNTANSTATDNVTSAASGTLSSSPSIVTGFTMDDANGTQAITAGTGFSIVQNTTSGIMFAAEDRSYSGTTSTAATFTFGTAGRYLAAALVFADTTSGTGGSVTAVTATATAAALAPAVSGTSGGGATVTAVKATATASALAPAVSGTTGGTGATVTAVVATATAAAPPPTVSGSSDLTGGGPAAATAAAMAPVVTGVRNPTVLAVVATATAQALPPTAAGTSPGSPTVLAVAASALASALAPVVTGVRVAQVTAVPATATAFASPPTVIGLDTDVLPSGNGYRFTPPTVKYRAGQDSDHLWGRITNDTGLAVVVYTDGRVVTTTVAPSTSDEGVALVWPGGRTYTISDGEAALLTEAGYSANLEEIV